MAQHLPFEAWIFEAHDLSAGQQSALREHLETCPDCQRLVLGWREVERRLEDPPELAPAPGFTLRWQRRLLERRQKIAKRQLSIALTLTAGGGALMMALMGIQLLGLLSSPWEVVVPWLNQAVAVLVWTQTARQLGGALLSNLTGVVPLGLWIALAVALAGMILLWMASLYRYAFQSVGKGAGK